jgi:predicted double-glycine peptidase
MHPRRQFLAMLGAAGASLLARPAWSEQAMRRPVPYTKLKYASVVRQTADFTCGAASVATILTYYWRRPTTEIEVLEIIRKRYTAEEWKNQEEKGVSFEDLIFASNALGFQADGAELPASGLINLAAPVIVHMDKGKFQHFSVLRKAREDMVWLSDTIVGETAVIMPEFIKEYSGKALAIAPKGADLVTNSRLGNVRDGQSVSRLVGDVLTRPVDRLSVGLQ